MPQTVAVTGATGFIGQTVCRQLSRAGYRVRALVRSAQKAGGLLSPEVEIVQGSLDDADSLTALVAGTVAVVHCAGAVRGASQEAFDRVNVDGVRMLLQVLESLDDPPRLFSLSSLAAREPALSHYAASKRAGEMVLINEARQISWMALRPPAVYGPGDKEMLPLFRAMARGLAPVPGAPDARFSVIFVEDLVAVVLAWLRGGMTASGVYTLDDGKAGGYDWYEIAAVVARLCNRKVRIVRVPAWLLDGVAWINRTAGQLLGYAPMLTPGKLRELRHTDWVCDSDELRAAIDWQPRYQLEDGLMQTPAWRV